MTSSGTPAQCPSGRVGVPEDVCPEVISIHPTVEEVAHLHCTERSAMQVSGWKKHPSLATTRKTGFINHS